MYQVQFVWPTEYRFHTFDYAALTLWLAAGAVGDNES